MIIGDNLEDNTNTVLVIKSLIDSETRIFTSKDNGYYMYAINPVDETKHYFHEQNVDTFTIKAFLSYIADPEKFDDFTVVYVDKNFLFTFLSSIEVQREKMSLATYFINLIKEDRDFPLAYDMDKRNILNQLQAVVSEYCI